VLARNNQRVGCKSRKQWETSAVRRSLFIAAAADDLNAKNLRLTLKPNQRKKAAKKSAETIKLHQSQLFANCG
jgi:hypothetical protein